MDIYHLNNGINWNIMDFYVLNLKPPKPSMLSYIAYCYQVSDGLRVNVVSCHQQLPVTKCPCDQLFYDQLSYDQKFSFLSIIVFDLNILLNFQKFKCSSSFH